MQFIYYLLFTIYLLFKLYIFFPSHTKYPENIRVNFTSAIALNAIVWIINLSL